MFHCRKSNDCPMPIDDYGTQRCEMSRIAKVSVDGESEGVRRRKAYVTSFGSILRLPLMD